MCSRTMVHINLGSFLFLGTWNGPVCGVCSSLQSVGMLLVFHNFFWATVPLLLLCSLETGVHPLLGLRCQHCSSAPLEAGINLLLLGLLCQHCPSVVKVIPRDVAKALWPRPHGRKLSFFLRLPRHRFKNICVHTDSL